MMARETHLTKEAIMTGVFEVAYKLLVNDKAKFTALLVGITFAVFLIVQMDAMFAGSMKRAFATVINLGASMWIMDPAVQTVANTIGIPNYVLDAARSMQGVSYAVPVYSGALVKLADGTYQVPQANDRPVSPMCASCTQTIANGKTWFRACSTIRHKHENNARRLSSGVSVFAFR